MVMVFSIALAISAIFTAAEAWYERKFPWEPGKYFLLLCVIGLIALLL